MACSSSSAFPSGLTAASFPSFITDSCKSKCTRCGSSRPVSVMLNSVRNTSLPACAASSDPVTRKRLPRLAISTFKRLSICRRCSSNWPHRLARRLLSTGSNTTSREIKTAFKACACNLCVRKCLRELQGFGAGPKRYRIYQCNRSLTDRIPRCVVIGKYFEKRVIQAAACLSASLPRREFGSASVIMTSTNCPIHDASASKFTQRIFSVRPANWLWLFFDVFSISTR